MHRAGVIVLPGRERNREAAGAPAGGLFLEDQERMAAGRQDRPRRRREPREQRAKRCLQKMGGSLWVDCGFIMKGAED